MSNRQSKSQMPTLPMPEPQVEEGVDASPAAEAPKMPRAPKAGIEVVALASGFYRQSRKAEGDKFMFMGDLADMGKWMKCVDPKMELEHQKLLKDKKAAK